MSLLSHCPNIATSLNGKVCSSAFFYLRCSFCEIISTWHLTGRNPHGCTFRSCVVAQQDTELNSDNGENSLGQFMLLNDRAKQVLNPRGDFLIFFFGNLKNVPTHLLLQNTRRRIAKHRLVFLLHDADEKKT